MDPTPVVTRTALEVSYTFHAAPAPQSESIVALHHGICHTPEQFTKLIEQLNARGIHAAMISQQTKREWGRNCIGLDQYVAGMQAAVEQIELQTKRRIGIYACHSTGALICEEMQRQREDLRRPTVLMAPIPVCGALLTTLRIMGNHPLSYLRAVFTLDIQSLARTRSQVRELFFDAHTPPTIVKDTRDQLRHAPFWMYTQLALRRLLRPRIGNDHLPKSKMLLYSKTDWLFRPYEYGRTRSLYHGLKLRKVPGGHDFFIENAARTADLIAEFHQEHAAKEPGAAKEDPPGAPQRPHFPLPPEQPARSHAVQREGKIEKHKE